MKYIVTIFFLTVSFISFSQVNWLSIEEAEKLNEEQPKKMLIFFETDWCGYCKIMKRKVFNDKEIATYLNDNFYPVLVNAEEKDNITFDGETYEFVSSETGRGANQLAIDMLQGRLAYPSTVFMETDLEIISLFQGAQPKELFLTYLTYLYEDAYKTQDWYEYSGQS